MQKNPVSRIGLIILLLILALPVLSACGKKSALKYPEGEKTDYPRQYPSK